MAKERFKLKKIENDLLEFSAVDMINDISEDSDVLEMKQMAFDYYNPDTKETYQVQVTVTREEPEFLEPFQTQMIRKHGHGN